MALGVCHEHLFPTMKKIFTLILLSMITFNAIHAEITWNLSDDGTLTISGTDMPYFDNFSPWYTQREKIKNVVIKNFLLRCNLFTVLPGYFYRERRSTRRYP